MTSLIDLTKQHGFLHDPCRRCGQRTVIPRTGSLCWNCGYRRYPREATKLRAHLTDITVGSWEGHRRAVCSCGWKGVSTTSRAKAEREQAAHEGRG